MIYIMFFLCWFISSNGQATFYDATSCREDSNTPGTRYSCSSSSSTNTSTTDVIKIKSCQTFLIFRANHRFPTISAISALFGSPPIETLLQLNNIDSALETLFVDREVFVPITCYCSGGNFFQTRFNYTIIDTTTTLSDIACVVFEGLVKKITLLEENKMNNIIHQQEDKIKVGFVVNVPLKCACPANNSNNNDYKYLVTYPLVSGDSVTKVSTKFGITNDDILTVNNLKPDTTVYPETTILVPFHSKPAAAHVIDFGNIPDINFQPPTPAGFLPTKPVEAGKSTKLKYIIVVVSIIGFISLVVAILFATALYIKAVNKSCREGNIFVIPSSTLIRSSSFSMPAGVVSSARPSPVVTISSASPTTSSSCLSPELFVDALKYSLYNFTVEELKRITKDFSNDCKVSENTFRGRSLDHEGVLLLIREIEFSEIRHVIDLHSKINHVNILKLVGVCYNNNNNDDKEQQQSSSSSSWSASYAVLEHPTHGSLRECLNSLSWHQRTQIAFDVAMGLHYLHYCIVPPHSHTRLGSGNIFVTSKWRAKLAVLNSSYPEIMTGSSSSSSSWVGMDQLYVLEKEDILEFGMVLLEILSGKVVIKMDEDRRFLRESIGFLGGGEDSGSEGGGCFGNLRKFMDPSLKEEDYPLAEALCLGVLAKACVGNDPLHRPSMEDVLKVLARMV